MWTSAYILSVRPKGTYFCEFYRKFSFKKMHLKMVSAKWQPFPSASKWWPFPWAAMFGGGGHLHQPCGWVLLSATTGVVWIIPSFLIWGYVLHVEYISCVITNCGHHQWVIPSLFTIALEALMEEIIARKLCIRHIVNWWRVVISNDKSI